MRLIDADEIMQRLSYNNGTPTVEYYNSGDPVTFEMREIKGLIRNAPTVSPWVKTADRLPDAEQIARNDKIFLLCKQHDGTYEAYTHWADGLASHPEKFEFDYWMPIPPLPEEEEI